MLMFVFEEVKNIPMNNISDKNREKLFRREKTNKCINILKNIYIYILCWSGLHTPQQSYIKRETEEKQRKNTADITDDIHNQEQDKIDDWEEQWFHRNGREYDREDPEFKMARELFMKGLVNQRGGGNGRVNDSLFKIVRD